MFRQSSSKIIRNISAVIDVMNDTDYIWYQDDTLNGMHDDTFDDFVIRVASVLDYHSLDISNKGLISYIISAELNQYKQDNGPKLRLKITGTSTLTGEVLDEQICTIKTHCHHLNKVINLMAKDGMDIHVDIDE